ncbi:unnamed protein product [Rhodiola kirilowii]
MHVLFVQIFDLLYAIFGIETKLAITPPLSNIVPLFQVLFFRPSLFLSLSVLGFDSSPGLKRCHLSGCELMLLIQSGMP